MKKSFPVLVILVGVFMLFSLTVFAKTNEANAPTEAYKYHLMVPLPTAGGTATTTTGIVDYIRLLYLFAIGIAGVLAMAMIIYAGFRWTTAAGNYGAVSEAKRRMSGAILGLILLLASYLILNTINPALVNLKEPLLEFMIWDQPFGTGNTPAGSSGSTKPQYCTDLGIHSCADYTKLIKCTGVWAFGVCNGVVQVHDAATKCETAACVDGDCMWSHTGPPLIWTSYHCTPVLK